MTTMAYTLLEVPEDTNYLKLRMKLRRCLRRRDLNIPAKKFTQMLNEEAVLSNFQL